MSDRAGAAARVAVAPVRRGEQSPNTSSRGPGADFLTGTAPMAVSGDGNAPAQRARADFEERDQVNGFAIDPAGRTQAGLAQVREELVARRLAGHKAARGTEIGAIDRTGSVPLSFGQRRLWFLDRLSGGSSEYLVPWAVRVTGPLLVEAMRSAWADVVARHEILRTRYGAEGRELVQRIGGIGECDFDVIDLTSLPEAERVARAGRLADEQARSSFDLETDLPARFRVLRINSHDHLIVLVVHHIACDGWSLGLLSAELAGRYRAHLAGDPSPAVPLQVQYADFAAWQRERIGGARLRKQLDYWRPILTGSTPVELPTDRPRPAIRGHAGATVRFELPPELPGRLRELALAQGTTLFTVLLAAFQVLLSRYSGRRDIAVGTAVAGRDHPETAELIGYLVNTVVVRNRWQGDPRFTELLAGTRTAMIDAMSHQDVPFERLVGEFAPERDLSRTPLFTVMFGLQPIGDGTDLDLPGLTVEPAEVEWTVAKFDLNLQIGELPGGALGGFLEYATSLFDQDTMSRLAEHYVRLLAGIAADATAPVSQLPMTAPAERVRLLEEWNDTGGEARIAATVEKGTLHERFEAQARTRPDSIALTDGATAMTYAELNTRSNQLAHYLRAQAVGLETLVGVCLGRGSGLVIALLGILKAGGAYVPLDPSWPADRLGLILADTNARLVVTDGPNLSSLPEGYDGERVLLDRDAAAVADSPRANLVPAAEPDNLVYVIHTSGSSGKPKGVCLTHRAVLRLFAAAGEKFELDDTGVWTMFHSYAFDFSVWELWGALLHGGRAVVVSEQAARTPEEFIDLLVGERVTMLSQTPSAFRALVAAAASGDERISRLSLRTVVFGGERLEFAELMPWADLLGAAEPELVNMYGITETTVHVTYHLVRRPELADAAPSLIGRALPDLRVYVLDSDGGPAPVGVPGEIHVGGPGVARGYLNQPALTAERFVPDPFGPPGTRLYRTGDLARWRRGGVLESLGRADNQVKIRGYRVELGEIEKALLACPGVRAAAIVLRAGEKSKNELVGYVVPAAGAELRREALREFVARALPSYMVPAVYVLIDELPMTPNGKLDHRSLPAPGRASSAVREPYLAPRTAIEEQVAAIWGEVLDRERVGVLDNFFELGGDSLSAVSVVGSMRAARFDVSVRDVFAHSTVAALCESLAILPRSAGDRPRVEPFELLSKADLELLPDGLDDAYPMSRAQSGMVVQLLAGGRNAYHNVTSFRIRDDQPFDAAAFVAAARLLVSRHEPLRTAMHLTGFSEPLQLVYSAVGLPFGTADLRGVDPAEQDRLLAAFITTERETLFDLETPPLLRWFVHEYEEGWRLSITECHAILEGWSYHSLLMELLSCYRALRDGAEPPEHKPASARHADFVALERETLRSAEHREYWADLVARHVPATLPRAWAEPAVPDRRFQVRVPLTDLFGELKELAASAAVSLKSVLHAAHLKVISQVFDESAFSTGLVCDTRPEVAGAERLYGMFLNSVPFPFVLGEGSWRDLVRRVYESEVDMWPHRRYPLSAIRRDDATGRGLIDVLFNYLDFRMIDQEVIDVGESIDDSPNEFPLTVTVLGGHLLLTSSPSVLARRNAEYLGRMYRHVLETMIAEPDGDAFAACLPDGEHEKLVIGWNDTEVRRPWAPIHELFAEHAAATPEATAVVTAEGKAVSYRSLDVRAARLAGYLRERGVGADIVVGVCVRHSADMLVALLGILKSGGAYVAVDPSHPPARLNAVLADAGADLVLTQESLLPGLKSFGGEVRCLDRDRAELEGGSALEPAPSVDQDQLAYVMYTSGSTGKPKGVLVTHRGLSNYLRWARDEYGMDGESGAPMLGSIAFDLSLPNLFLPLISGRDVTLLPENGELAALAGLLARQTDFSLLKLTPAHLEMVRGLLPDGARVRSVRTFVVGGEELRPDVVAMWRDLAPGARLINEYGPTESVVGCAAREVRAEDIESSTIPVGRPIDNTRLYILDHRLNLTPLGVPGELYIGGAGLARGYRSLPGLTAERFVPDPFGREPGGRLYRTGDLARYRPDGTLEFLGRIDEQFKILGYRVEPGEIEARLTAHPDVAEAIAVARTDDVGHRSLAAYVVTRRGCVPDVAALREFAAETLPGYLVPATVMMLDAIPVAAGGKVDRAALPAPEGARPDLVQEFQPARTPLEARLAEIWVQVLGVDRVGRSDNFHALGGDSTMSLRVAATASAAGIDLPLADVLAYPTIAELAGRITGALTTEAAEMMRLDTELAAEIRPRGGAHRATGAVLLTGATGFVGAFLLRELLDRTSDQVICLVRAGDAEEGAQRVREVLRRFGLPESGLPARVEVVPGDLSAPRFGLSEERYEALAGRVGRIYHNGAMVNALYGYPAMRAANVLGTEEILRLACVAGTAPVHYVSTLSVLPLDAGPVHEASPLGEPPTGASGYTQSKWVAEQLVRSAAARGMPVSVYRLGTVAWHSRSGAANPRDVTCQLIVACARLGAVPVELPMPVELAPVDFVVSTIVDLSRREGVAGETFHVMSPHVRTWCEMGGLLTEAGCPAEPLSYADWHGRLRHAAEQPDGIVFRSLLTLFPDGEFVSGGASEPVPQAQWLAPRTTGFLAGSGLDCPPMTAELLGRFLARQQERGLLGG
ncbi:amino acid adenylation domain-containing protein [Amycolatopsis sp. GA6-003]|uniref:non-ribosomal peptide synthetase n=1 Tax=Amycolatopsis sp. GA6-003 TaxID=2652444 RepID=UPI0039172A44